MKNLYLLFVVMQLSSVAFCQSKRNQKEIKLNDIPVYNLSIHWNADETMKLSDIAESIEYIPLEVTTDPRSLISGSLPLKVTASNSHFLCYYPQQKVCLFTAEGRFLREIGKIGKGPGEYIDLTEIKFTKDGKGIWFLDPNQNRLINYSLDNRLIRTISTNPNGLQFSIIHNKIHLLCIANHKKTDSKSFIEVLNMSGELIEKIPLYKDRKSGPGQVMGYSVKLNEIENRIFHFETPFDTVFELKMNSFWEPVAVFEHGPDQIPFEVYERNSYQTDFRDYLRIKSVKENSRFYFFEGSDKEKPISRILVDKHSAKVTRCSSDIGDIAFGWAYTGLKNDLDNLLSFWPKALYQDQYLYSVVDPWLILEYADKNKVSLPRSLNGITEESNPVIIKIKLKQ